MNEWKNFHDPEGNDCGHDHHDHESCGHGHHHHPLQPIVRKEPKIGRNDPCICGSGKKYKKCCGA